MLKFWLLGVIFVHHALAFKACRSPSAVFHDGLCFAGCPPGFFGHGAFCWADVACRPRHSNASNSCRKMFYSRGFGKAPLPVCHSSLELVDFLCYPKCRQTYRAEGRFCVKRSSKFPINHGSRSSSSFYSRGDGNDPVLACNAGLEMNDGVCYPPCRAGFAGVGDECWKTDHAKSRGQGTRPGRCDSSSFTRTPAPSIQKSSTFTIIIANDPQIVWWSDPIGGESCQGNKRCKKLNAEIEAHSQVRAMNAVQSLKHWPKSTRRIEKPLGVIINGDLTSYFHPEELDLFERYYVKGSNSPHRDVLQYPLYLSLGNHDYANNVGDCDWMREPRYFPFGKNGCAQKAVDYIKGMISCGIIETFPHQNVESYDSGSLAYSWNIGDYHFIQLHNYPSYKVNVLGVTSSMKWLKADLERAKARRKNIVINLHDLEDHFKPPYRDQFDLLISKYKVVGIFCGHKISSDNLGYQGVFGISKVPVFRGGHGGEENRNKFLLVEFSKNYYRVVTIDSKGGVPKFHNNSNGKHDKTIAL